MTELGLYIAACQARWRRNIGTVLRLYVLEVILAYKDAGYTPEEAADLIQLALQRAWPESKRQNGEVERP